MDAKGRIIGRDLSALLGEQRVLMGREERLCYSYDATNLNFLPTAVVFPNSSDEVVEIVRCASTHRMPIVPRGAGTGFTGGSIPTQGGLVISFEKMNRLLSLEVEDRVGIVEPGIIAADFQRAVEEAGLFYPPDPSSLRISTIGGNVAECAGGLRCKKYGVTKDYVLGLEFVVSSGNLIRTGIFSAGPGYDMTGIMVGSEGTLGAITRVGLRLIPRPDRAITALLTFRETEDAARTVAAIIAAGVVPAVMEYVDGETLECVSRYQSLEDLGRVEAVLLVELDGTEFEVAHQKKQVEEIAGHHGASELRLAESDQERETLWLIRRSISPSLARIAPIRVNEDVCVPPSKLPNLVRGIREIAQRHQLRIYAYGHAGDGNLHVNIMVDSREGDEHRRAHRAVEDLFEVTLRLGGTLSGEHGIGITKAPYLKMEVGATGLAFMRRLKEVFDPLNLMNPGKIFP